MSKLLSAASLFALSIVAVGPAAAIDGEVLLNHGKALNGNVTPGDDPGYPIRITRPGSYKFSANLAPTAGTIGIQVTSHDVTIDFNGFRLHGGGVANNGIVSSFGSLTIKNGMISLFKFNGISGTGPFWIIDNMRIVFNAQNGIIADGEARQWIISNSQIVENTEAGIVAISAGPVLIQNNVINGNGTNGIYADNVHVEGNMVIGNGHSSPTSASGIAITDGTVLGNTIIGNVGFGLDAVGVVGYGNNTFTGNNGSGAEVNGGFPLDPNVCNGTPC